MDNKTFIFKLIDIFPYVKGDKHMYRLVTYCYFGYNVTFFLTEDKYKKLIELQKSDKFNINDYIRVFYDNSKQQFAYVIKF